MYISQIPGHKPLAIIGIVIHIIFPGYIFFDLIINFHYRFISVNLLITPILANTGYR